jgi:hemolysin activation/secretion protein
MTIGGGSAGALRATLVAMGFLCSVPAVSLAADVKPPADQAPAQAAEGQDATFDLLELRVLGNSVLETRDIERTVYPFLGPKKTLKDIESARVALEKTYHDRGYGTVFVDIPEQTVDEGIVRLRVTEGKIGAVHVTGARYFSGRQIRAMMPEASPGVVPQLPALQAQITAANTVTPDRIITPVLKSGAAQGTMDLTLRVDDHLPLHASLEFNNEYTQATSPLRAVAVLSYDNLFGRFDSLSFQYQTSPRDLDQVKVFVGNYVTRIGDLKWAFYYLKSDSNVPTLAGGTTGSPLSSVLIVGRGSVYGTRLAMPLPGTSSLVQNLNFGAEYKDFLQNVSATPLDPSQPSSVLETPVRYINFSLGYGGFWRGSRLQSSIDSSLNFAARGLASSSEDFENKRYLAKSNYFYFRSSATLGATLPWHLTGLFKLSGQYSADPLVSNEQFAIAGSDGVRGYLEAEVLADTGFKTTFQLGSPTLNLFAGNLHSDAFVFYDYGRIGLLNPLPNEDGYLALRSAGAGFNISLFDHFTGALTWAYPLANGSVTLAHDSRFLFSVRSSW